MKKQIVMKQIEVDDIKSTSMEKKKMSPSSSSPPAPPPLPPLPSYWIKPVKSITTKSVTNEEIAKFWRQKKLDEEDHLLAAIKAAARLRARNFTEEDYRQFAESLEDDNEEEKSNKDEKDNKKEQNNKEIRIGIKDWWTKSKYAYLNQPAIETVPKPKKTSTYIPNFCFYKPPPTQPAAFGVFI